MNFILILCTSNDEKNARQIASSLVGEKLAACVNIIPSISSIYQWRGSIVEDKEMLMIIKSRAENFEKIRERIISLHSYDTPEIISVEIKDGDERYLNWIKESTI